MDRIIYLKSVYYLAKHGTQRLDKTTLFSPALISAQQLIPNHKTAYHNYYPKIIILGF